MSKELREKEQRVRKFLLEQNLDALLITKRNNFSWFTCGADNYVALNTEKGASSILISKDKKYLIGNNIEVVRMKQEELVNKNFEFEEFIWYDEKKIWDIVSKIVGKNSKIGSDLAFPSTKEVSLTSLQSPLLKEEIERYKWLGKESSTSIENIAYSIKPGLSEYEVAGRISESLLSKGIIPVVILVAADERIFKYRHPIPTDKKIRKYVMLVLCAQKYGLIVSLTRLIYFGRIPKEIKKKHDAVVKVDATFILNSKPKAILNDIFSKAVKMYAETGYRDEWKKHHQGGPTGYMTREYRVNQGSHERLVINRALAWNPSIRGTKSEDTIVVKADKPLILTQAIKWPMIDVEIPEGKIKRPDILER